MATYRCPRCRAEVEKSAVICGACSIPIAPLPWLRRLHWPGRHSPDAQVVDYARAALPLRSGAFLAFWLVLLIGGGLTARRIRESNRDHPALQERVLEVMQDQGLPDHLREGVQMVFDAENRSREGMFWACVLCTAAGALGTYAELTSFLLTRRLLAAIPLPPRGTATPSQ
ncbi:MAG: hypothetical protein HUU06_13145 [Planctomycetaceae bacterium]|nr:hypothetical protein [Planctomycetaceae bacterium]